MNKQFESVIAPRYEAEITRSAEEPDDHIVLFVFGVFEEGSSEEGGPIKVFDVLAKQDHKDGTQWHGLDAHEGKTFTYNPSHEGL